MPKKAGGATAPVAQPAPAPGGFDQFQNPIAPGFQAPAAAGAGQVRPLPQPGAAGAMVAAPAPAAAAAATSANAAVEAARLKAQAAQQAGGGGGKKFESNPVGEQRGRVRNFVADLDEQLTCEDGTSTMLYKLCHLSALFCGCLVPFGAWWHPSVFDAVNNRELLLFVQPPRSAIVSDTECGLCGRRGPDARRDDRGHLPAVLRADAAHPPGDAAHQQPAGGGHRPGPQPPLLPAQPQPAPVGNIRQQPGRDGDHPEPGGLPAAHGGGLRDALREAGRRPVLQLQRLPPDALPKAQGLQLFHGPFRPPQTGTC